MQLPEEAKVIGSSGAGVIDNFEWLDMGVGNWTWVLCNNSIYS